MPIVTEVGNAYFRPKVAVPGRQGNGNHAAISVIRNVANNRNFVERSVTKCPS